MNPYKTNVRLWEEKDRQTETGGYIGQALCKYGVEAPLRKLFALDHPQFKVTYRPFDIGFNKDPFIFATLYGRLKIEKKPPGSAGD